MIDISTPAIAKVAAAAILLQRGGRAGSALRWDAASGCWRWSDPNGGQLYAWPAAAVLNTSSIQSALAATAKAATAATAATVTTAATAAPAGTARSLRLSEGACALVACTSGRLLLGQGKRLGLVELPPLGATKPLQAQVLLTVDAAEPRTAISDGCTDRAGNFVFGTANTASDQRPIGSFYQYSQRYGLRRLALPAVVRAAGIAFSADGKHMFFADGGHSHDARSQGGRSDGGCFHGGRFHGGRILQCAYDAERAMVGDVTTFAETVVDVSAAVIDRTDCLWSLQGGDLVHYDAQGTLRRRIVLDVGASGSGLGAGSVASRASLPGPVPASLAFGGEGLGRLLLLGADGALYDLPAGLLDPATAGIADTLFDDAVQQVMATG